MTFGISRVHGSAVAPSQRPSTIRFFTITFEATQAGEVGLANGTLDQIFRTAIPTIGTVAMIGTLGNSGTTLRFAVEDTGTDTYSPSFLGTGPSNSGTTAAAIQAAIRDLNVPIEPGSSTRRVGPNQVNLSGVTVADFVL